MILKIIREVLGRFIVFVDFMTRPSKIKRSDTDQKEIDRQAKSLSLYQFYVCPFCVKVRRAIHKLNVPIVMRDAQNDLQHKKELLEGGGKSKVPCLRVEENGSVQWMYESNDIIRYLNQRFKE